MNIAITADLHLTTQAEHPERYAALEDILKSMSAQKIGVLVIAGDLFDASRQNYAEFEAFCKRKEFSDIQFHVIPGNHDPSLAESRIVAPNLRIYSRPEAVRLDPDGPPFLFLPYEAGGSMGGVLAGVTSSLPQNNWILVAHGDWLEGLRDINLYENGFYMPLARKDINQFKPLKVFLGHNHGRMERDPVYYPGSPCGMDITETGRRSFLVFDTRGVSVESETIHNEVIYCNETITILPLDDEEAYLRQKALSIIAGWKLNPEEKVKVRLRLKVNGYSTDRQSLLNILKDEFKEFSFHHNEEIEITSVSNSDDPERSVLAVAVQKKIMEQVWPGGEKDPSRDDILLAALGLIYGGKS